ncbi:hypothetical protein HBA92_18385 [Ochrobactrum sp. MR28]|nr:hypothetical protein [Ochrobactrum sp. MR28]MBX8818868.1 hypothetical protein [Ochrobactrum sp. MR31]
MAFAKWHSTITDLQGNVIPHAFVTVRDEATGALAVLYEDREGATGLGNPFQADNEGLASFHVRGGAYHIAASFQGSGREWRYVGIGTAQELDAGTYGAAIGWDATELTTENLNKHSGSVVGFRVLVIDAGDQRAAIYERISAGWSLPIYLTGTQGRDGVPVRLTVGTVTEGDIPSATITGDSPELVLNLVLVPGPVGDVTPEALAAQTGAEKAESNAAASDRSAAQHATDAEASQMLADQQSVYARDWAQTPEDELVDDGEHQGFSARHWAEKSKKFSGKDGREVEIRAGDTAIEWRYAGDENWQIVILLADLTGADGRPVKMQQAGGFIQWAYAGSDEWVNLVALTDITGPEGAPGKAGTTLWSGITDKPVTFPPSEHTHDSRYYTKEEINALLAEFAKATNPTFTGHVQVNGSLTATGELGSSGQ